MTPQVTVDASEFNRKLIKLAAAVKVEAVDLVRGEARMVARDLIRVTTPYGTNNAARDKGRGAIIKDLLGGRSTGPAKIGSRGIFFVIGSTAYTEERKSGNVMLFAKKNGDVYGTEKRLFRPNASIEEMEAHHQKYRSRSTGRTTLAGSFTRNIGRWKFVDRMVVSGSTMQKYLKHVLKRVGWMKSGWVPAFRALGGKRVPAWIDRHSADNVNGIVDLTRLNSAMPTATIGNKTPGVRKQVGRHLNSVIKRGANRMYDKFIKVMLGHKYDIKNGVVRIHRPKQEGFSA